MKMHPNGGARVLPKTERVKEENSLERCTRPPLVRMQRIHELLQAGGTVTCRSVACEFEASQRTILRDLDFMRDRLSLPIEYQEKEHTFAYSVPVSGELLTASAQRTCASVRVQTRDETFSSLVGDEAGGHLAVICHRHGLKAEHVLRGIVGEKLADAVSDSRVMSAVVRAAQIEALDGREEA